MYIRKADLIKYGFTPGCKGCISSNRGESGVLHNKECRTRIEARIQQEDPERTERELDRMLRRGTWY